MHTHPKAPPIVIIEENPEQPESIQVEPIVHEEVVKPRTSRKRKIEQGEASTPKEKKKRSPRKKKDVSIVEKKPGRRGSK